MRFMLIMLCNVMLRRVPCYGCALCASLRDTDDGLRTETCSSFSVLMCKFYICALVGIITE